MAIQIKGDDNNGGNIAVVDINNNLNVCEASPPAWPSLGGYYTVAGQTSAIVAATLAASTTLASMRMATNARGRAFVTKIRVLLCCATVGTSALVPGTLGLQRFNTATPTGGTARTVNRMSEISGNTSDMTDVRDSNAALTVTSVVFGSIVGSTIVPLVIVSGITAIDWVFEPAVPLVLNPGDGLALRTQIAMPATQTWVYSYSMYWSEE